MTAAEVRTQRFFSLVSAAAVLTSVLLAFLYYRHVPMSPDGGWYAYPSYAWANGGDPSENMQGFDALRAVSGRLVAMFGWENRSNLTVPGMGLWFKLMPASAASIALLGVLQWLSIAALSGFVVWCVTLDRMFSVAAALITFSDSRLIAEAVSDARPDVPVLLVALALLATLIGVMQGRGFAVRIGAIVLAAALPLVHVTSANVIACLSAFAALWAFLALREGARISTLAGVLLPAAVMCVVFLLRQPILDGLVPTSVPKEIEAAGQHSLVQKLKDIIAGGLGHKLAMEAGRWAHQFHPANLAQALTVLAGLALAVRYARAMVTDAAARIGLCLFAGLAAGVIVMMAADPHHTPGHALVLAVIGYCATATFVARAVAAGLLSGTRAANGVLIALSVVALLKAVHAGQIEWTYAREGISTDVLRQQVLAALPPDGPVRIEGASEIWPYLMDQHRRIEIIDPDRYALPANPNAMLDKTAKILVISDDHYKAGWAPLAARWQESGLITLLSRMGECGRTARCLEIYKIENR